MSYTPSPDDTQPRRPNADARPPKYKPEDAPFAPPEVRSPRYSTGSSGYLEPPLPPRGMNGCAAFAILAALGAASIIIVALAGLAGWTSGQRQAAVYATATQNAAIQEQWSRISGDVESGNTVLLEARIRFLATLTPGVPGVPELFVTATALANGQTPTLDLIEPTPTPDADSNAIVTPAETPNAAASTDAAASLLPSGLRIDLPALLSEAQSQIATSQWADAIDTLDVIIAVDPNFQTALVRSLMIQALSSRAMQLYNSGQPAAGNLIVSRIEEFGTIPGDLAYERYAAQLYLNARALMGVNFPGAIQALRAVMDLGAGGRYYQQAQQALYETYVAYGDAFTYENNWCSAATQYRNAMNIFASGVANGKFTNADTICRTPPTVDPLQPPIDSTLPAGFVPLGP
ncbi:MAG: hypothetical protein CUN53_10030 [Phototrophicales bacterium]|nr:MAG: hypothetical protein CUN53_10030 [Phototrophicales bacterium]